MDSTGIHPLDSLRIRVFLAGAGLFAVPDPASHSNGRDHRRLWRLLAYHAGQCRTLSSLEIMEAWTEYQYGISVFIGHYACPCSLGGVWQACPEPDG